DTAVVHEIDPHGQLTHWYMNSDARSTAIALSAMIAADPKHAIIDKLVAGLKRSQRPAGHWYSTSENLFALAALADYARNQAAGKSHVAVLGGGAKVAQKDLSGGAVLAWRTTLDKIKPGALRVETDGTAHWTARLVTARRDPSLGAESHGFTITRKY